MLSKVSHLVALLATMVLSFFLSRKWGTTIKELNNTDVYGSYLIGGGIFVGTFMLGNNFNYRLIFLLFTFPFLFRLNAIDRYRKWMLALFAVILLTTWRAFFFKHTYSYFEKPFHISPFLFIVNLLDWFIFISFMSLIWEAVIQILSKLYYGFKELTLR